MWKFYFVTFGWNIFTCPLLLNDFESDHRVSINKFAKMPHTHNGIFACGQCQGDKIVIRAEKGNSY